jgi:hypothetical protein
MGDVPTHSYPPIVYCQRRDRQGVKSSGYKKFYGMYFNICGQSAKALLIADSRQRLSYLKSKTRKTLFSGS